jgi:ribosomal protein L7/L12
MEFNGKIAAIKAVRSGNQEFQVVKSLETGRYEIVASYMGLKEAKDMVEAIMRLGVREWLNDQANTAQVEANKAYAAAEIRF